MTVPRVPVLPSEPAPDDDFPAKPADLAGDHPNVRRVPYRLPGLLAAVKAGEDIYVTEGEKDADAIVREGATATSAPAGAGKWRPDFASYFEGAELVLIVADRDKAGYRHAMDVARSLRPVAKAVAVLQALEGKDVSDHLVAGHALEALDVITTDELEELCGDETPEAEGGVPSGNEPQSEDRPVAVSSWKSVDLAPVLRGEVVTKPPSVFSREDGVKLFYPARINALFGETEGCKSFLVALAAKQELAAGHHVVFCDFEDSPESLVERLRALGVSAESIESHLTYIAPAGAFDELAVAVIQEKISERGVPTLVVGDGVTEAMSQVGLDPNVGPDVAKFYASWPRAFASLGAAVALVDHVTKSTEGRGRWAIGSERKLSGLDGAAYAVEVLATFGRGRTGKLVMTVSKDRCGYVRQHQGAKKVIALVELKSWPDGGVTMTVGVPEAAGDGPFRPTHLMHKLSEAIAANPGLSKRALRSAVHGSNDAKDLALEMLIADEYVRVDQGSNNTRKHFSVRPYISVEEVR
jgi:AAA domain